MGRSPLIITQGLMQRMLRAAKKTGHDVLRVEADPRTGKVVLVVRDDGGEKKLVHNPLDNAPTFWSGRKDRR